MLARNLAVSVVLASAISVPSLSKWDQLVQGFTPLGAAAFTAKFLADLLGGGLDAGDTGDPFDNVAESGQPRSFKPVGQVFHVCS